MSPMLLQFMVKITHKQDICVNRKVVRRHIDVDASQLIRSGLEGYG